jgi:class 3 adenylate cyclase
MDGRPTGTVTFLFTDVEGSTRLWEDHPAEMHAALARHDGILRTSIECRGGYVFATTPDGCAAAFAHARHTAPVTSVAANGTLTIEIPDGAQSGPVSLIGTTGTVTTKPVVTITS